MKKTGNVAIVGAGTMGHSLAQLFAQHGFPVRLHDVDPGALDRARGLIAANLRTLVEAGALEEGRPDAVLQRIQTTTSLGEAVGEAGFVVEAISEDRQAKRELFRRLDALCPPQTILASNTSYMDIFQFVETARPDKVLIAHFFAPPHIVPLVEIVRGPKTSRQTVERVKRLLTRVGKCPIVISRFLPGFIANRLQSALTREVLYLLDNGYATAEEIDLATKAGFGLRMPILGVVKRIDYAGLDLTQKVLENGAYEPPPPQSRSEAIDERVARGRLGVKSGGGFYDYGGRSTAEILRERDIKLLRLKRFLEEIGEL